MSCPGTDNNRGSNRRFQAPAGIADFSLPKIGLFLERATLPINCEHLAQGLGWLTLRMQALVLLSKSLFASSN